MQQDSSTKLDRMLSVYHYFCYSEEASPDELCRGLHISGKTLQRYLRTFRELGLLNLDYHRHDHIYTADWKHPLPCTFVPATGAEAREATRLCRLCHMVRALSGWDLDPRDWYQQNYPELSKRTMQRDFRQLERLGYVLHSELDIDVYEDCDQPKHWIFQYDYNTDPYASPLFDADPM